MWNQRVQVIAHDRPTITNYENLVEQAGFDLVHILDNWDFQDTLPARLSLSLDVVLFVFPLRGTRINLFHLIADAPRRPTILVVVEEPSGHPEEKEALRLADDFLYSPFSTEELLLRLTKLARQHHQSHTSNPALQPYLVDFSDRAPELVNSSTSSEQALLSEAVHEAAFHLKGMSEAGPPSLLDESYELDLDEASRSLYPASDEFPMGSPILLTPADDGRLPSLDDVGSKTTQVARQVNIDELLPEDETTPLRGEPTEPLRVRSSEEFVNSSDVSIPEVNPPSFDSDELGGKALSPPRYDTEAPPFLTGSTQDSMAAWDPRDSFEVPYEMEPLTSDDDPMNAYLDVRAIDSAELLAAYRDPQFSHGAIVAKSTVPYNSYNEGVVDSTQAETRDALPSKREVDTDHELKQVKKKHQTDVDTIGVSDPGKTLEYESSESIVAVRVDHPEESTNEEENSEETAEKTREEAPATLEQTVDEPLLLAPLQVPAPKRLKTGTRPSTPAMIVEAEEWMTKSAPLSSATPPVDEAPAQTLALASGAFVPKEPVVMKVNQTGEEGAIELTEPPKAKTSTPEPVVAEVSTPASIEEEEETSLAEERHFSVEEDAWLSDDSLRAPSADFGHYSTKELQSYGSSFSPLRSPLLFSVGIGLVFAVLIFASLQYWKNAISPTRKSRTASRQRVKPAPARKTTLKARPAPVRKAVAANTSDAGATPDEIGALAPPKAPPLRGKAPVRRVAANTVRRSAPLRRTKAPARTVARRKAPVRRKIRRRLIRRKRRVRRKKRVVRSKPAVRSTRSVRRMLRSARRYMRRGGKRNFRRARSVLLKVRKQSPRNIYALVYLGKTEYELGNSSRAMSLLRSAARRSPRRTGDGLVTLGAIYYERKQTSLARRYYRMYIRYFPRSRTASEVRYILQTLK